MNSIKSIIEACQRTNDLTALRSQCVNGYGANSERRAAYRLLLDIPKAYSPTISPKYDYSGIEQIRKDVNRSYSYIKLQDFKEKKKTQLLRVLACLFEKNPNLIYYQGFHDIAIMVLSFSRESLALLILEKLGNGLLKMFMGKDLDGMESLLLFCESLLKIVNKDIFQYFERYDIQITLFTSYIMTLFANNVSTFEYGLRFLDFFIASHPLMPIYTIISLIDLEKIKMTQKNSDPSIVQNVLQETNISVDRIIQNAVAIYQKYPPNVVLDMDKTLEISEKCDYLSPSITFPYSFPSFPFYNPISLNQYTNHLEQYKGKSLTTRILKELALAASIGMKILIE